MAKKEKERRYRKRRGGIAYTILAVLLIAASVVAACTVFFRVEEVTVEGNERYSQEQILSVASVEMGANMILTPGEQIAQRILGMMERLGMEIAEFSDYLRAHRNGLPPHGGLDIGLERLTMKLAGAKNIREAALFPRDIHRLTP